MAPYTLLNWIIYLGLVAFAIYIVYNYLAEGVEETLYDREQDEIDDDAYYGDGWVDEIDGPIYEADMADDYDVDDSIAKLEQVANGKRFWS